MPDLTVCPLHPTVAVGLVVLLLSLFLGLFVGAVIALADRMEGDDLMAVADAVREPPPVTMIVCSHFEIGRAYAVREGLDRTDYRVATNVEAMRGHRGPVVVVDGERTPMPINLAMHDAITALRAAGCPIRWDVV